MKFLLVFAVLAIAWAIWRSGRKPDAGATPPVRRTQSPPGPGAAQDMVPCAHCGLHLPASEAVRGHKGQYCGEAHLRVAEPEHGA